MRYQPFMFSMLSALSLLWPTTVFADSTALSPAEKAAVVAALNNTLAANYAFPETTRKIDPALRDHLAKGDYDAITTKEDLAHRLTDDLLKISGDLHFFVGVNRKWVADFRVKDVPARKDEIGKAELGRLEESNFGFDEVRRLSGNIGYIRFSYFADP